MPDAALAETSRESCVTEMVAVNGVHLAVRSFGSGSDVIVLHGGPGASCESLIPAHAELAQGRRLHFYDQRGCGKSPVSPNESLSADSHVEDLLGLLEKKRIGRTTVIGHSWGALLALLLATRNPDRVRQLVLVTPASISAKGRKRYSKRLAQRTEDLGILSQQRDLLRSDLRESDPAAFRQRAFELSLAPYLKDSETARRITPFQISHRVREAVWRSLGEYDLTSAVKQLTMPALVIHGRYDPIPLSSSQQIAKMLGARIEILENSGHLPFFEEPDRFVATVDAFLTESEGHVSSRAAQQELDFDS